LDFYPDYCFPTRKQGSKIKMATASSSAAPMPKRAKVLTRRPKPHSLERTAVVLDTEKMEIAAHAEAIPLALETIPTVMVEASVGLVEGAEAKSTKVEEQAKLLSPQTTMGLPKLIIATIVTPRKRRIVSVLDAILKSSKVPTPASIEASEVNNEKLVVVAASVSPRRAEAGPSRFKPTEQEKEDLPKKPTSPVPEASFQDSLEYIVRHASGKQLLEEQIAEAQHYAKDLKYPRVSLIYKGDDEDDFLYCPPDNKEINVCQEMMDNMGYPKLELGLSAMTKDQLVDSLVYNSLKVCIF
jgi:hypothetical protein